MTNLAIEHIVSTPGVCGGKPCLARKAISVAYIAGLYKHEWSAEGIAEEFELTLGEVYAALSYYFDHREEIEEASHDAEQKIVGTAKPLNVLIQEMKNRSGNHRHS